MRRLVALLTVVLSVAGAAAQSDHLVCFKVKDSAAKVTYTADIDGLVLEPGCRVKVPAAVACLPATKTIVGPPFPPGGGGTGTPNGFFCYKMKCPKMTLPTFGGSDQFGSHSMTPKAATLICAPVASATTTTTTASTSTTTGASTTTTTTQPACTTDTDCAAADYCNANACVVGCRQSPDNCPSGTSCDAGTHICVSTTTTTTQPACTTDTDCAAADYCNANACVVGCRQSPDNCGPGLACSPVERLCLCSDCTESNPQLTGPHVCVLGNGTSDQCVAVACEVDTDCATGNYCNANACVPGCRQSPDNCPSGTSCDAGTHTCL